ncbi:MAG: 2-C-methyl-D-erythritol 4-phosphate cytidylyltransferase [Candidatus Latescibacteria bacterium]|nr:2-C-methyl-D-erythritol 4-phosphate cytidylyltransferase [bacterium]MBD3423495.1 2-C-methyl-D-erythritol 4-phosphate cytidylyltransferase [Candidatus Latescibacterota bacterium]
MFMSEEKIVCIVAGAGRGKRFGKKIPKGFFPIEGRELFVRSIESISKFPGISEFIVLVPPGWEEEARKKIEQNLPGTKFRVMAGGDTRQQSVALGLKEVDGADLVLVHDACRPFVSGKLIDRVVEAAREYGAAVPVMEVTDTLARVKDKMLEGIVPRERVVSIQTPQAFGLDVLRSSYDTEEETIRVATDESSLAQKAGYRVRAVEGELWNIKVTVEEDLEVANCFLTADILEMDPEEDR